MKSDPTLADYLFVTPDAYTRVFDLPYQIENYVTYHRRTISRLFHALCTTPGLFGWFLLFSYLNLGLVFLVVLSIWYLRMDWKISSVTIPMVTLMWIAANMVGARLGPSTLYLAFAVMGLCSLIQALSHSVEDVPPPLSNRKGQWAPVKEWVKETSMFKKITLLVWGTVLEWISFPRLFPVQISLLRPYLRSLRAS
jgi:hypothetical protein